MKFYGNGIVWNPSTNRQLCEFIKGELETNDKNVINQLIKRGYKYDGETKEEKEFEKAMEEVVEEVAEEKDMTITDYSKEPAETREVNYSEEPDKLEELSYADLKVIAKNKGILKYMNTSKKKLIKALKEG